MNLVGPTRKVYGAPDPGLTYQITGGSLVAGDSLTGTLAAGVHSLSAAYNGNGNYNVSISPQYVQVVNSQHSFWVFLPVVLKQ